MVNITKMNKKLFLISFTLVWAATAVHQISAQGTNMVINTVSGPIRTPELGLALPHEHVMSNFGAAPSEIDQYDEQALMQQVVPYLQKLKSLGVGAVFDCTTAYFGRRPDILKIIADSVRINIITNTGYYGAANDKYVPGFVFEENAQQIATRWINEFKNGIEASGIRPGFIKLAFDDGAPSEIDLKLFEAGAITHLATGLTLAVHTGNNQQAVEAQLQILRKHHIGLENWIWVHANKMDNTDYLIQTAAQGAWISLDGVKETNVSNYVELLQKFKAQQLLDQVLVSHDGNGFPRGGEIRPFSSLLDQLIPALNKSGFSEQDIQQLTTINPSLAFEISAK